MQREAMKAGLDEDAAEAGLDAAVENWLERMAAKHGTGHDGAPLLPETKARAVRLAHRVFRGDQPDLLADYVDISRSWRRGSPRARRPPRRATLTDFSTWAGADPYTVDEVRQLLTKRPHDSSMRDVTVLALWTGMRLEELCQLKVEHVKDGCQRGGAAPVVSPTNEEWLVEFDQERARQRKRERPTHRRCRRAEQHAC
jgi:integrase